MEEARGENGTPASRPIETGASVKPTEAPEGTSERAISATARHRPKPPPELPQETSRPIEFLSKVQIEGAVELGRVGLELGELLELAPGSVLRLEKMVGEPVELRIKDRLIAKGEVFVIDYSFGLRITEIFSYAS